MGALGRQLVQKLAQFGRGLELRNRIELLEGASERVRQAPHGPGRELGVTTSVAHTFFLAGQYKTAIDAYSGRTGYYLDAAAWAALDDRKQALALLRERLSNSSFSKLITALMTSLFAMLEGKTDEAKSIMDSADTSREPEILLYFARHYCHLGLLDPSIRALEIAARSGFICAPETLKLDPWFVRLPKHKHFGSLLSTAHAFVEESRSAFAPYADSSKFFR